MPKIARPPRTDLERFMRLVGATTLSVAEETGLAQSTVWRCMAGTTDPSLATYKILSAWADTEASRLRISRAERLGDWTEDAA